MKAIRTVSAAFCSVLFLTSLAHSGILGDVNNDGKIGFPEAINALQVLSGVQTTLPANFVIRWMGDWTLGHDYEKYDAVHFNGSSYIALFRHQASAANDPTHLSTWNPMAMGGTGPQGLTGPQGPKGDTGTTGPAGVTSAQATTLSPGSAATAAVSSGVLTIGVPRGQTGATGPQGPPGPLNPNVSMDAATYKTAVGMYSLLSNTGERNTSLGYAALHANGTGYRNTAVGNGALYANMEGYRNTAVGTGALNLNQDGNYNTAVGNIALNQNYNGHSNTAVGDGALYSNTDGDENTALGLSALYRNITGNANTATGRDALYYNTDGNFNTANGYMALYGNSTGSSNTAMGFRALELNQGNGNTAFGNYALNTNTTGHWNTAVGGYALNGNTEGNTNTALGRNAGSYGDSDFTGSGNIYLGYDVRPASATESDTIRIGKLQTATYIKGIYSATSSGGVAVYVNSSGKLGTTTSSRRYKEDITDMGDASSNLMKLRPVAFHYKPEYIDGPRTMQYGLIAEEVAEVYPELVVYDPKTGQPQTVSYHLVNALLLNEVQKQQRRINDLEERLARLESMIGK